MFSIQFDLNVIIVPSSLQLEIIDYDLYKDKSVDQAVLININGSCGQAVMIVECEKMVTGSNFGRCTLISDIEIDFDTDERNGPRNMPASEFTH